MLYYCAVEMTPFKFLFMLVYEIMLIVWKIWKINFKDIGNNQAFLWKCICWERRNIKACSPSLDFNQLPTFLLHFQSYILQLRHYIESNFRLLCADMCEHIMKADLEKMWPNKIEGKSISIGLSPHHLLYCYLVKQVTRTTK